MRTASCAEEQSGPRFESRAACNAVEIQLVALSEVDLTRAWCFREVGHQGATRATLQALRRSALSPLRVALWLQQRDIDPTRLVS